MRLLGRGSHTLIRNVSLLPRTDVGSHNPSTSGEMFPHPYKKCFVALSNRYEISQSTPWGLAYRSIFGSNIICNSPNPPLVDIVLFGLSLLAFPWSFKTRLLGRGFDTLIRNVLFPFPTNVGSHKFTPKHALRFIPIN